jgi:DNA-binding NarL/FixJ family response regulator
MSAKEITMRTATVTENAAFASQHVASVSRREGHLTLASDNQRRFAPPRRVHLTPRQRDVLTLLCEGLPNKLICRRLNISSGTVKAHISSILRELGVSSRLQAVVAARETSLLAVDYESSE